MFCAYTVSCHNPGLMLMDVVIVVHCPRQEKLQCDPQYFRHCGDPALGVACHAGKECMFFAGIFGPLRTPYPPTYRDVCRLLSSQ